MANPLRCIVFGGFHVGVGKYCPFCGKRTDRARTPWFFRLFRILLPYNCSTRFCESCGCWAMTFHR